MRRWRRLQLRVRELVMVARALYSYHPLVAQLVATRRCNLHCRYCNERDSHSKPVPLDKMIERVDRLAELGTAILTFSGGEPLLHPGLEDVIARGRQRRMIVGAITNGVLLSQRRIDSLNRSGLDHLQISIDNVEPDEVSRKSLGLLERKLTALARSAEFKVNINSVLGAAVHRPEDALVIARRAVELGFTSTVGILHDGSGQLESLGPTEAKVYRQLRAIGNSDYPGLTGSFQDNLAAGQTNRWRCRAGARYLYVCEDGLVHYCSQQRGTPGIPLERYTVDDIKRAYLTSKPCAARCTIGCVHRASTLDAWRGVQRLTADLEESPSMDSH